MSKTPQNSSSLETVDAFEGVGVADDAPGLIRGVKLLGLRSRNKRNYDTPGVRKDAASKLNGAAVFIDHPADPSASRSYADKFGVVEGYEYRPGKGHYGNIRYNQKHPLAEQFLFDVQHMPRTLGMSINGRVRQGARGADGDVVIEGIDAIRSVDIVTRPATTDGIFEHEESEEEMSLTLEELRAKHPEIVEQIAKEAVTKTADATEQQKLAAELAETKKKLEAMEAEQAATKLREATRTKFAAVLEGLDEEAQKTVLECACQAANQDDLLKAMTAVKAFTPAGEDDLPIENEPLVKEDVDDRPASGYVAAPPRVGKTVASGTRGSLRAALKQFGVGTGK